MIRRLRDRLIRRKPAFGRFAKIREQFLHGVALGGAPGNGGHLGPKSAFFNLVDDGLQLYGSILPVYLHRCKSHNPRWRGP